MTRRSVTGGAHVLNTTLGILTLPAAVDAADPTAGMGAGGEDAALSIDRNGRTRVVLSTDLAAAAPNIGVSPYVQANSLGATGSAAAPGAGANIVTIASGSLPSGTYDVQVIAYLSVAGTKNNVQLLKGATVISTLLVSAVVNIIIPQRIFRVILDGTLALNVNTVAADAAGTYEAELVATRIA